MYMIDRQWWVSPTRPTLRCDRHSSSQKSIVSTCVAGKTKILPSPMRPVRATSTILRTISSARDVVDPESDFDLGQKGQRVFAVAVLVEIALLPAVAFHLAHAHRFQRRTLQALQAPFPPDTA